MRMKQLSFFEDSAPTTQAAAWHLFVDGAARNNPGPAGAGIYITKNGEPVIKQGFFLGNRTNNQAEYMALVLGLCQVRSLMQAQDKLHIFSDSELLIRQLQGRYAVKNKELRILFDRVKAMLVAIPHSVKHVMREQNTHADALANEGIDKKHPIPQDIAHLCRI
jgi:ribonuclease HI